MTGIFLNRNEVNGYIEDLSEMNRIMVRDIALLTNRTEQEVMEEYATVVSYQKNVFRNIILEEEGKENREEMTKIVGDLWKEGKLTEKQKKSFE